MQEQKSCGFVLFREEHGERKYLVLKYDGGHWGLVKGTVEEGEEELQTATREATEETGIQNIQVLKGVRESISYYYVFEGKKVHKTVIYFLGKTTTSDVILSPEHKEFKWLSWEDAKKRLTFENDRRVVTKAEKILSQNSTHLASFRPSSQRF